MKHYQIKRMSKDTLQTAIDWAAKEGWNPGKHDAQCFYQTDPNGFFAGYLDGQIIAVGSAIRYDEHFAFCGFYIVEKKYRGQGFGLRLTKERLAYVGSRNAGIDGVLNMVDKYKRLGYQKAHHNIRFQGQPIEAHLSSKAIVPLENIPFHVIQEFDRKHFPAPRTSFLKCWLNQPGAQALGYIDELHLRGYGVIRPCQEGFKIGPLFAESETIASALFSALTKHAKDQKYYLDVPDNNPSALALVKRHNLQEVFETARMYLKGAPDILSQNIYGITTFELG